RAPSPWRRARPRPRDRGSARRPARCAPCRARGDWSPACTRRTGADGWPWDPLGSAAAYIAGARGGAIGPDLGIREQAPGPFGHDLGHALGRHAELALSHAAIHAFMVFGDMAIAKYEPAHPVDHDLMAPELRDGRHEPRQRARVGEVAVADGIEE